MSLLHRTRSGRSQRTRGQALVEFALVIPLFLLLLIALFDLGRAVFAYNTLTNAAREGARIAIVNQDQASILAHAKSQTAIVELDDPSVDVKFWNVNDVDGTADLSRPCPTHAVGCLAVVTFESTYRPMTPFISNIIFGSGVTFKATSVLSVEFSCPSSAVTAAQCPKQP
jgi:Flp pilus assembly protein TadG